MTTSTTAKRTPVVQPLPLPPVIAGDEWVVHYQPQAQIKGGGIVGVEALVRRIHPQGGLIYPDQFIGAAEETGLIRPLTLWVLEEAMRQAGEWAREGIDLNIGVNLSVKNLQDPNLADDIARLLHKWNLPPERLTLEITESALMADPGAALPFLARVSAMGTRLALDDFGTGYSSLAHLRQLPVDQIKIDRSFVMSMADSERDSKIVSSTIELGRSLGLEVVAEGVEVPEAWRALSALGCHVAQGYHLSAPLPADEFAAWLGQRDGAAVDAATSPRLQTGAASTRVMVVEDHTLVRQSLIKMLGLEPGFHVVGESGRADEAVEVFSQVHPDLVLLDVELPGGDGLWVAAQLRRMAPEVQILFLTMKDDDATIRKAISLGAAGYVPKTASSEELIQAIRAVASGGSYLSPPVARRVMGMMVGPDLGLLGARPQGL